MTRYESDLKTISSNEEVVFNILSDLNNLEKMNQNPQLQEKVKEMTFDRDNCSFKVDGIGEVSFRISERLPFNLIKFTSESSPIPLTGQIILSSTNANETNLQLALEAEIPAMIKMMIDKKLKDGINMIAETLAKSLSIKD